MKMDQFELNYLHLADGASSGQLGKLSIYGIFERVLLGKVPGKLLKFVIVGSISFKKGVGKKIKLEIKIIDPKKRELKIGKAISKDLPIGEKGNKEGKKIGFVIEIGNLEFKTIGKHQVIVYVNKKKIGSKKLIVTKRSV